MDTVANVYLTFNDNCREAMNFYKDALGANLQLQTVKESPTAAQMPPAMQDHVMHAMLTKGSLMIMGSDMVGPGGLVNGNNVAILVNCSSEEEINAFFSKLSAGGQILDPLQKQFWGAIFGALNDKFGIRWMFNCELNKGDNSATAK